MGDATEAVVDIDNFCHATGSEEINIDTIAKLFDRDRRPGLLERIFMPPDLWRQVHNYPRGTGGQVGDGPTPPTTPPAAEIDLAMTAMPLENGKTVVEQALQDSDTVSGLIAGLRAEIHSVSREVFTLRGHIENMQVELLHETERRFAALRGELAKT